MKQISALLLLAFLFPLAVKAQQEEREYMVVISLDAFRWDYPDKYETPNLNAIRAKGVKAERVKSSFPTLTFPNHYTMATGLYPDNHGIVHNKFYAADIQDEFRVGSRHAVATPAFWRGEPVWVTAETQGVNTAAFYWVGSETPVKNTMPRYYKNYQHHFPFEHRVDTVLHWLNLPDSLRPHLIMWYFHEPDEVSHHHGPEAPRTAAMVRRLDSLLGVFMDSLSRMPLASKVNVIITADHGMAELSPDRTVCLDDYLDAGYTEHIYTAATTLIYTKPQYREQVYAGLQRMPHVKVYKREELPDRYHYGTNPRIGDLVVAADCGWTVLRKGERLSMKGAHGFDNACGDMDMIFFAYGPAFRENYTQTSMSNTDLYNLITHVLKLKPAANDGDMERVKGMLKE